MWTFAQVHLGLSAEEFYALTPRQLDALTKRHLQKVEDGEFALAQLTACVVNFSMRGPKEMVPAKDFMLSQMRKAQLATPVESKRPKRLTKKVREEIAEVTRNTLGAFWE